MTKVAIFCRNKTINLSKRNPNWIH